MSSCECSICYEDIDVKTTGEVKLSCSHSYHFSCISSWFATQEKGSCPCCRKEMGEKEDLVPSVSASASASDEDSDDDDDDDESDDGEDYVSFNRTELNALIKEIGGSLTGILYPIQWEAMRKVFMMGNPTYAGEVRIEFNFSELNIFLATHCWETLTYERWARLVECEDTPSTAAFESASLDFSTPISLPLQPYNSTLSITWSLLDDGSWTRTVNNPEEVAAIIIAPALTAVAVHELTKDAATKVQAVWRGFSSRVRHATLPRNSGTNIII